MSNNEKFLNSVRNLHPLFNDKGPADPNTKVRFRVNLKTMAGGLAWVDQMLLTQQKAKQGDGKSIQVIAITQDTWDKHASVAPEALAAVRAFRKAHPRKYKQVMLDKVMGFVDFEAKVADITTDWNCTLREVINKDDPNHLAIQRVGEFGALPAELADWVVSIHISQTPAARAHYQVLPGSVSSDRPNPQGFIRHHHQILKQGVGDIGPRVGEARFTGFTVLDTQKMYHGVTNVGTKIKACIGFGPNTAASIADQIIRAVQLGYKFITWSWGLRERGWTDADRNLVDGAIKYATLMGCVVGFASGDTGANDGGEDPDLDFGGSDPFSLDYGGTRRTGNVDAYWNDDPSESAGGYGTSTAFTAWYQGGAKRKGPDLAGPSSPASGFRVRGGGQTAVIGGTSDIPWLIMEIARLSAKLGVPIGHIQPWLYARVAAGIKLMTPVLDSSGQTDPRCGLGTPIFQAWFDDLKALIAAGASLPIPDGFVAASFGSFGPGVFCGELGGGLTQSSMDQYAKDIGVPSVPFAIELIDGGQNQEMGLSGPGGEVYLDACCMMLACLG